MMDYFSVEQVKHILLLKDLHSLLNILEERNVDE